VCKGIQSIVVVQMSGGRVQECDSCGEEAAPGGLSPEAPVAPPRGQEGEESVCWVIGVFDDFPSSFQTPLNHLKPTA